MRMRNTLRLLLLSVLTLHLAACDSGTEAASSQNAVSVATNSQLVGSGNLGQQRLAISHNYTILLPKEEVERVQRKQAALCLKMDCSVISSTINRQDNGMTTAALSLRIAPAAFDTFIKTVSEPPAHIVSHTETADDKTVPLLDIEARLKAKKDLQGQLQDMQKKASSKGSLSDVIAIEKELSQVQSDIDSATSQYNYLKTLTETIKIDIHYQSEYVPVRESEFTPIFYAAHRMEETFIRSVALIISFVAAITPWLPIIALAIWGIRRLFRLRRKPGNHG
jgi:hypothetical protein